MLPRLRNLAKTCEFADAPDTIVDQIIEKCTSSKLRKRLLREKDLTLDKTLEIAQIMESTDRLMEKYNNSDSLLNHQDSDNENVHHITSKNEEIKNPLTTIR